MATTCPVNFDVDRLRHEVRDTYARVAVDPDGDFHFHRVPAVVRPAETPSASSVNGP